MSSGWLVALRRGPVLPVSSSGRWNQLAVGGCRSPGSYMTYATAMLDGINGSIGSKSGRTTCMVVSAAGHIGKAAKLLVSSWDRSCNRVRVALLVKTISPSPSCAD